VNALQNNELFRNAKTRIERTAYHLIPSESREGNNSLLENSSDQFTLNANAIFKEVFVCPVCGNNLQCSHEHHQHDHQHPSDVDGSAIPIVIPLESMGTVGKTPDMLDEEFNEDNLSDDYNNSIKKKLFNSKLWFGPLVLASFAVVGLAIKIFSGEISVVNFKSISSRAFAAITILIQANNSVFDFINHSR